MTDQPLQSETVNDLAAALAKAQAEMHHAKKDASNPYFKSKYADLASVMDASRPHLAKHGLCVTQLPTFDANGKVTLVTLLMHASGQWVRNYWPVNPVKADPQGFGSALTYARRYAYSSITGVAADDDDGNAASQPNGKAQQQPRQPEPEHEDESHLAHLSEEQHKEWRDHIKATSEAADFTKIRNDLRGVANPWRDELRALLLKQSKKHGCTWDAGIDMFVSNGEAVKA